MKYKLLALTLLCFTLLECNTPKVQNNNSLLIYAEDVGAYPNDSIPDAGALQIAINVLARNGGGLVRFDSGLYIIDKSVIFKPRVVVIGNNTKLTKK